MDNIKRFDFKKIAISLISASVAIMLTQGIFIPKIQIADFVFLLVFIPFGINLISAGKPIYWSEFIKPIIIYLIIAAISIFISIDTKTTLIEFIGILYLIILFLLWINMIDTKELLRYAVKVGIIVSAAVSSLGLIGIVLAYGFDINNPFVMLYKRHPYINNLYRVHSTFFMNEKFLASYLLISIPLVLSLAFYEKKRKNKLLLFGLLALFLVNVFFTFSRSITGILLAIYIVLFRNLGLSIFKQRWFARILKSISIIFIIIIWLYIFLISHIQLINLSSKTESLVNTPVKMSNYFYYRPDVGFKQTELNFQYLYTLYFHLKQYALKMFIEHPFKGVGNGAFIEQMKMYDLTGKAPKNYLIYDPHSMFFGALAELGIFGFLVLIYLWFKIILTFRKKLKDASGFNYQILLAVYAASIGFFLQGIDLDIMNFRFLWLLFGFGAIVIRLQEKESAKIGQR